MRDAVIKSDGASSGNPGPSGIGAVIEIGEKRITISEPIGKATNNVAEYTALVKALEIAQANGAERVKIYLDSELLVRQLNGIYRVKNKQLIPLYSRVVQILNGLKGYNIIHIPREENRDADALAKNAVKRSMQSR